MLDFKLRFFTVTDSRKFSFEAWGQRDLKLGCWDMVDQVCHGLSRDGTAGGLAAATRH